MLWSWFGSSGSVIACGSRKPWTGSRGLRGVGRSRVGKAAFGKGSVWERRHFAAAGIIFHSSGRKFNPSVPRGELAGGQTPLGSVLRYCASCEGRACLLFFKAHVLKPRFGGVQAAGAAPAALLSHCDKMWFSSPA